jgi:hypothetical protein
MSALEFAPLSCRILSLGVQISLESNFAQRLQHHIRFVANIYYTLGVTYKYTLLFCDMTSSNAESLSWRERTNFS